MCMLIYFHLKWTRRKWEIVCPCTARRTNMRLGHEACVNCRGAALSKLEIPSLSGRIRNLTSVCLPAFRGKEQGHSESEFLLLPLLTFPQIKVFSLLCS
jgi:hypothetical protein